jgi:uncharacterized repeat protein (TIGR01451 family)
MLFGGAAAITLGAGLACPARAADGPQVPWPAALSPAQPGQVSDVSAQPGQVSDVSAQPGQVPGAPAALSPDQPGQARWAPSLVVHKAHQDPVAHTVEYTLWVSNGGTAPTRGTYTVVDSLPEGTTATSVDGGQRWRCAVDTARTVATCTGDENLAPRTSSDPIIVRADITQKDPCLLVNMAAVSGGSDGMGAGGVGDRGEVHLTKDVVTLPCHRQSQAAGVTVNVNVVGNNNGGHGGNSSGATANDNGHIHGITGGIATANAKAKAGARAHATAVQRPRSSRHGHIRVCLRRHSGHSGKAR